MDLEVKDSPKPLCIDEFSDELKKIQGIARQKLVKLGATRPPGGPDFDNFGNFDAKDWGNFHNHNPGNGQ